MSINNTEQVPDYNQKFISSAEDLVEAVNLRKLDTRPRIEWANGEVTFCEMNDYRLKLYILVNHDRVSDVEAYLSSFLIGKLKAPLLQLKARSDGRNRVFSQSIVDHKST